MNEDVSQSTPDDSWIDGVVSFILWSALLVFATVPSISRMDDPDLWGHLKTGEWILENCNIPQTDPFTVDGEHKDYVAYFWLFSVLSYLSYNSLGYVGIALMRLALTWLIALILVRFLHRLTQHFPIAAILCIATLIAITPMLSYARTWLVSILFFILTLDTIVRGRSGESLSKFWWLPVIYVLWANTHVQFLFGLWALGLFFIEPIVSWFFGQRSDGISDALRHSLPRGGLMLACFGGTFLTPYGLELYQTLLGYAADKSGYDIIREFKAPGFRFINEWVALALTLFAVFVTGWKRRIEFFPLLLFSTSVYVSFQAVRDIWLVAIVSAWFIAQFDWNRVVQLSPPSRYSRPAFAAAMILSSVLVVLVCLGSEEKYRGKVETAFPVEAVKFMEAEGYEGPLLCDYGWGGYLIWQLPQVPVFIDGRAHVHGLEAVKEHYNTLKGTSTWHQNKNLNESEIVLIPRESALASLLRLDPRFRLTYEDEIAVVFENSL